MVHLMMIILMCSQLRSLSSIIFIALIIDAKFMEQYIVYSNYLMLSKKYDSNSLNNLFLRTDGFKHVFKGLTYKHSASKPNLNTHSGTYTSIGKRTPAREYHFTKDGESKLQFQGEKSKHFRRTQTAQTGNRASINQRQKQFLKIQKEQCQCFDKFMLKFCS